MKKKIIFIQQTGALGGSGISLLNTINMLKETYNIVVYCPNSPMDLTDLLRKNDIEVKNFDFQIGCINYYSGGPKLISRSFFLSTKNIFRNRVFWHMEFLKEKPDYVAVNSMILAWMEPLIREVNAKSICFIRETLPSKLNFIRNMILKRYLNKFSGVCFISEYDIKHFRVKHPKVAVIRDCLIKDRDYNTEPEHAWPWEFPKSKLNLLFVGGSDPIKGLHVALRALGRIEELPVQLIVAGYIDLESYKKNKDTILVKLWRNRNILKILRILKNNEILRKVKFVGIQKDMSLVYSSCDVLLFPSTVPHQSRPAFEIGLYNKMVIISDFKQTQEFVVNNKNGLTFKANSDLELAKQIEYIFHNKCLMTRMGITNAEMTKNLHDYQNVKSGLLTFFKDFED